MKSFKIIIIIANLKEQSRPTVCRGLARLRNSTMAVFTRSLRPQRKPNTQAVPRKVACTCVCTPHPRQRLLCPTTAPAMGELRTSATGGGDHSLRSMLWGPPGWGEDAAPKSTAFADKLWARQAGGCGAPKHRWVRRKNKPQHPLLSGLNNRWPLFLVSTSGEGNKNAALLFVASLEFSLYRQRPRKNKTTQEPYPGGESEDPVIIFFFHFPEALVLPLGCDIYA